MKYGVIIKKIINPILDPLFCKEKICKLTQTE